MKIRLIPRIILIAMPMLLLFNQPVRAQHQDVKIPGTVFRPPLGFTMYLSGTFGEPRSGHLHSGIDIKTQGVQGKKVYAVDNGYVSRIRVAPGGYGKAIYITHPNGLMSVYGHLSRFNWRIQRYVRKIQYERKSFSVNIFPAKKDLPVKKGQVIAFSGNTGSSTAPHLHFELRIAKTQHPVNPLLFKGINVKDHLPPKVYRLAVYPSSNASCVNGKQDTLVYYVSGKGKHCYIKMNPVIRVSGPFSFGLQTTDVLDKSHNHDGVYRIELYEDGKLVYGLRMKELSFATTRYVNSLIDYHYYEKKDRRLYRTEIDPNNRVMNYFDVKDKGVYSLHDTAIHHFKYVVSDIYGNHSVLPFRVQASKSKVCQKNKKHQAWLAGGIHIPLNKTTKIDSSRLRLSFSTNTFYRPVAFHIRKSEQTKYSYAPVYALDNRFIPVQKYFRLSMKPDSVSKKLKSKLYIAYAPVKKMSRFSYAGGKRSKSGWLVTHVRTLGYFTVMADTIQPTIKPLNFKSKTHWKGKKSLKVWIKDGQTGIRKYTPTLNGHWILMEYDPKIRRLTYYPDEYMKKGKNKFKLVVQDAVGNKSTYEAVITVQ